MEYIIEEIEKYTGQIKNGIRGGPVSAEGVAAKCFIHFEQAARSFPETWKVRFGPNTSVRTRVRKFDK